VVKGREPLSLSAALLSKGPCLFFAISKTIGMLTLPTNFLIDLGLLGAVLLITRWASLGRALLVASVVLLAISGFSPLGNLVMHPLEARFPPWEEAGRGTPDGIIVLGGTIDAELSKGRNQPVFTEASERIFAAAALARRYPQASIVFTGGSADLVSGDAREADYAPAAFERLGIAKERILIERRSRNTAENAAFTKDLVKPQPGQRWLLVTSAYHMPRSVGLFRKIGFEVEAYPVDWRTNDGDLLKFRAVAHEGLDCLDTAVREWVGLVVYWATGQSSALFPAPDQPVAIKRGETS